MSFRLQVCCVTPYWERTQTLTSAKLPNGLHRALYRCVFCLGCVCWVCTAVLHRVAPPPPTLAYMLTMRVATSCHDSATTPGIKFVYTLQRWLHIIFIPTYKKLLKDKARGIGSKTM